MEDDDGFSEGVMYACPACDHPDWLHPEMVGGEDDSLWCAECAHELGPWGPLYRRLFPGAAMLAETLAKKS
ncbi:hypothetical protein E1H18_3215 [Caulobacter sp. RHG1]|nr:hypothetical protein [Caulobacter sp. RHG1]